MKKVPAAAGTTALVTVSVKLALVTVLVASAVQSASGSAKFVLISTVRRVLVMLLVTLKTRFVPARWNQVITGARTGIV